MTAQQHNNHQQRNIDSHDDYINYAFIALMGLIILAILMKYLAFFGRYIYFSFLFPFYALRKINPLYEMVFGLLICGILLGYWFYKRIYKGNRQTSLLPIWYSLVIFVATSADFVGLKLLTGFVDLWCKPNFNEKAGVLQYFTAIFNCSVSFEELDKVGLFEVMLFAIFPNIILAMWANYQVYSSYIDLTTKHPKAVMRGKLDLESLIRVKTQQQPHLNYYQFFDLNKLPIDSGQFRKLDSGRKFMYRHNLIQEFVPRVKVTLSNSRAGGDDTSDLSEITVDNDLVPIIKTDAFNNLMIEQLGEPFIDIDSLSPLYTILLAITIPKACLADTLLDNKEINQSKDRDPKYVETKIKGMIVELWDWASQKINKRLKEQSLQEINLGPPSDASDFPKIEEYRQFLKEWVAFSYIAQNLVKQHAYCSTLLMASLSIQNGARKLGVMASADFRCIIEYDRTLWAIIQNTDRSAAFSENIATVSHYYAELAAGIGLIEPMFQSAYEGFMKEVTSYNYPKEHIAAWEAYNKGDPSLMIRYRLITKDESIYKIED